MACADPTVRSRHYSIEMMDSHLPYSCEIPPFQYCDHVSDCSVQCAIGSRNPNTTAKMFHSSSEQ